jgi:hypothetical protein
MDLGNVLDVAMINYIFEYQLYKKQEKNKNAGDSHPCCRTNPFVWLARSRKLAK